VRDCRIILEQDDVFLKKPYTEYMVYLATRLSSVNGVFMEVSIPGPLGGSGNEKH